MEVLLQKDVDRLGKAFEVLKVKDGYALNYLFPNGLAVKATEAKIKRIELDKKAYERKEAGKLTEAQAIAGKLSGHSVTLTVKVGDDDQLFGSVTAAMIADKLSHEGLKVDRKDVILEAPIKAIGIYTVQVRVHSQLKTDLKVWVVKEGAEPGAAPKTAAPAAASAKK